MSHTLDALSAVARDLANLEDQVIALTAERDALRAALSRYGRHDSSCPLHDWPNLPGDPRCTCGFSAAFPTGRVT